MKRIFFMVLGLGLFFCAMTSAAQAQATRTWVSGLGDDANPCSRTAPCKTFPGAYSRTAVGGEIDVIDPGGFGTISISHALTIDGGGGIMASILASSGTTGVNINAAATDNVILRNLSIEGVSQSSFPGSVGIALNSGRLSVEHCVIENFSSNGITNNTTQATFLSVRDTTINNVAGAGIYSKTTSGTNAVVFSNSFVYNSGSGLWASANSDIEANNSTFANNTGAGLYADAQGGANALINANYVTSSHNAHGMLAAAGGSIRVGASVVTFNTSNGVLGSGGFVQSYLDNYVQDNAGGQTFNLPNLTKS
ncbi:MAG TPA: right-handed parallel beta-helix repeat-containing protein [Candidatus Elarobacter sp.]|nr:right-handed parallel beta-helix repeat-containing protein [Candidatus Elarobacter sp.]HEV2740896.1 right-handed parallel beta-helix repeat-containing protein [Candidatus Elarobacter sp.]